MQPVNLQPLNVLLVAPRERIGQGILSRLHTISSMLVVGQIESLAEHSPPVAGDEAGVIVVHGGDLDGFEYDGLVQVLRPQPDLTIAVVASRYRRGALDRFYQAGVRSFVTEDVGLVGLLDALVTIRTHPHLFLVRMGA
ncbi:MAG TPA: hypothetical protein PKE45_04435 [Caldilineaceae bacterium]|nr:hypothetical protein [Caldilineaceae bacterium]